jgi:hypothetical protein
VKQVNAEMLVKKRATKKAKPVVKRNKSLLYNKIKRLLKMGGRFAFYLDWIKIPFFGYFKN